MSEPIRVVFSTRRRNILAKAIRWFTRSTVSHVVLMYWDEDWKRHMVMEATVGGFRIIPFDKFEKQSSVVAIIEPKHSLEKGLLEAVDYLGSDFDYVGLFGMAWVAIGRWFKKKWKNPLASANALFCSEIVAYVCKWSDYPGTLVFEPENIEPEDLFKFFMKERQTV